MALNRNKKIVEVLETINSYQKPGKKTVQKLLYLIERRGVELDLDYRIHFFGPYSATLDDMLHALQNNEVIDIDASGTTHTICVKDSSRCEGKGLFPWEKELVNSVIEEFRDKNASELEAITTLDYVAHSMKGIGELKDIDIIKGVKEIKGTKYSEAQLSGHLDALKQCGYI
jgi:uncharacterized protein YwgA